MDTETETPVQNGQSVASPVTTDPLKQINQANLSLASILEQVLKDTPVRRSLLGALDRQTPVEEGEPKTSEQWLQAIVELCEQKRVATEEMVRRAVEGP